MTHSDDATPPRRAAVTSRRRVHDGFLKIDAIGFRHTALGTTSAPDGMRSARVPHEVMERGDSVAALVHDVARDRVHLVEQFRIAAHERGTRWSSETEQGGAGDGDGKGWMREIVAGGIAEGETPEEAIRREIREEIGLAVRDLRRIGLFYLSPGGSTERMFLFYATAENGPGGQDAHGPEVSDAESDEDILPLALPAEALLAALDQGLIEDAKTLVAAQWFALERRRQAVG